MFQRVARIVLGLSLIIAVGTGFAGPTPAAADTHTDASKQSRWSDVPDGIGAAPRFVTQPALKGSTLTFSLRLDPWRTARHHRWAMSDQISGTVRVARRGVTAGSLGTRAQMRKGRSGRRKCQPAPSGAAGRRPFGYRSRNGSSAHCAPRGARACGLECWSPCGMTRTPGNRARAGTSGRRRSPTSPTPAAAYSTPTTAGPGTPRTRPSR